MFDKVDILLILHKGKLNTYKVNPSFIKVYYTHPDLEGNAFYVFTFLTSNEKFLSVKIERPNYIPIKLQPKVYIPIIEMMVKDLVSDYNSGTKGLGERFH